MGNFYSPPVPHDFFARPLTGGMVTNKPATSLGKNEFLDHKNYYIRPEGLEKRYGLGAFTRSAVTYGNIIAFATFWTNAGVQKNIIFDEKFMYVASISSLTAVYQEYADELFQVTVADTAVSSSGTSWTAMDIQAGDILVIDTSAGHDWSTSETAEISAVTDELITITADVLTDGTYYYKVRKAHQITGDQKLDYVVADNSLIFTDNVRPVRAYNGSTLNYWSYETATISGTIANTDWDIANDSVDLSGTYSNGLELRFHQVPAGLSGITAMETYYIGLRTGTDYYLYDTYDNAIANDGATGLIALTGTVTGSCYCTNEDWDTTTCAALSHFNDRIFYGYYTQGSIVYRSGVTWSGQLDKSTLAAYDVNLPYTQGRIRRLVPLGNLLIAYFTDAVWIGRKTNQFGDTLPVAFDPIETGGRGLVGSKAVCSHLDGHYFISVDEVYYLSNSYGLKPIGTKVTKEMLRNNKYLIHAIAIPDPDKDRIVFGIPSQSDVITTIWSYYYNTDSWGYENISCNMMSILETEASLAWDDADNLLNVTDTEWDNAGLDAISWDSLVVRESPTLFIGIGTYLYTYQSSSTTDSPDTQAIISSITTGDIDHESPNVVKTFTRFGLKLSDIVETNATFTLEGSTDRGNTWVNLGAIVIASGKDEDYVNFRITGSICRFRLTHNGIGNHTIAEYTYKLTVKSREFSRNG